MSCIFRFVSFCPEKKIQMYIVCLFELNVKWHACLTSLSEMYRFYGCSSNIKAAFINVCDGYTYYLVCMSVTLTDWSPPHCFRLHPLSGGGGGRDRSRVRNQGQLGEREIQHWPDHGVRHHTSLIQTNVFTIQTACAHNNKQMKMWPFKSMCC